MNVIFIASKCYSDRLQALFAVCSMELAQHGTYNSMFEYVQRCRAEYRSEYVLMCQNICSKRKLLGLQQQLEGDAEAACQRQLEIVDEISGLKAEIDVVTY